MQRNPGFRFHRCKFGLGSSWRTTVAGFSHRQVLRAVRFTVAVAIGQIFGAACWAQTTGPAFGAAPTATRTAAQAPVSRLPQVRLLSGNESNSLGAAQIARNSTAFVAPAAVNSPYQAPTAASASGSLNAALANEQGPPVVTPASANVDANSTAPAGDGSAQLTSTTNRLQAGPTVEERLAALETRTAPKMPLIKLGGFFQLDHANYAQDIASRRTYGDMQDGTGFRRARLQAYGSLT